MNIVQTRYFKNSYKKLHANQIKLVNDAIRYILSDPQCGEEKKCDLAGVLVHKFRVQDQQFLLAYEYDKETLFLLALGVHENFYRDLKKARS
jgi:mRNA-degrading endonuclease RelE of RelBE toxin-antitoxin system